MSALNLPKPKQVFAGEDELRKLNGGAQANGGGAAADGTIEDGVRVREGGMQDEGEYQPPRGSDKYKIGMIFPPREIRGELCSVAPSGVKRADAIGIVDKTAIAISKSPHPKLLEDKIREHQKTDPKFAFLNDEDPYHQYYRYMREKVLEDAEDVAKGIVPSSVAEKAAAEKAAADAKEAEELAGGSTYEPKQWEFRVDLPGVTAMDL
jgi:splicing factor 3A subunit 1